MVSTPKAPDPVATAQAQSGMNRDTAITQQQLNMTNQVTPDGSLSYRQTGESRFTDSQGNEVVTPTYTAYTELSPQQQAIKDQTDAASLNLGTIANDQSAFLRDYMGKGVDMSGVPALQKSLFGLSGDIGGGYKTSMGGDYSTSLGGNYTTDLGSDWKTSYAGADDFSADRQRVTDAIKARAAPEQASQARALESQLIGRGLRPGTAAWNSEMDRLSRSQNDFSLAADLAGGQEQSRLVGLSRDAAQFGNDAILTRAGFGNQSELARFQAQNDATATRFGSENAAALAAADFRNNAALTEGNFNNAARAQGTQEAYAARSQPINEIAALLSGSQVQNPNFVSTPSASVAGVDYTGLVNDQYKSQLAASQAKMGGLFGLAAAPFSMFSFKSDRRSKKDIRRIGTLRNGLPWYEFRYLTDAADGGMRQGVMSDDVRKVMPHAVGVGDDGYDFVKYDLVLEAA